MSSRHSNALFLVPAFCAVLALTALSATAQTGVAPGKSSQADDVGHPNSPSQPASKMDAGGSDQGKKNNAAAGAAVQTQSDKVTATGTAPKTGEPSKTPATPAGSPASK